MEIRTYTDFWEMEKKLYALNDVALPFPLPLRTVGVFGATAVPWMVLLWLFHVPFNTTWWMLWFIVPLGVAFFASKPIFERKTLFQYLTSRIRFIFQSQKYKGLREWRDAKETEVHVESEYWTQSK